MANENPANTGKGLFPAIAMGNRDVAFAIGVAGILVLLLLPLPVFFLDMALTLSFSLSVLILMVALWIQRGTDFSSFPTVLLVVTMLRLALNVATTRAILTHGAEGPSAAGHVIQGFSSFIMSGNYVIGFVIFIILLVINFIVITKGATRIAEVSARFTLDAIPGKQMAIDADLSSGAITEKEANKRRQELEEESGFYGSMDGASKFVQGDAIASLIVTCINLIGGMIIGVMQHGLSFSDAAATFSILTVGDGLVSTFPALLVSLAAGLIISKGSTKGSADQAVLGQLGAHPKAMAVAAGFLFLLGVAPGLPLIPFWTLGTLFAFIGWAVPRHKRNQEIEEGLKEARVERPKTAEETVQDLLQVDEVSLELGMNLVSLASESKDGLPNRLRTLRDRFATDYGFVLPTIQINDSMYLENNEYRFKIQEIECARGTLNPSMKLMMSQNGTMPNLPGIETKDPVFGIPSKWIDPSLVEEAEIMGLTVASPEGVVITHISEAVKSNMADLLSYAATERLLGKLSPEYSKLLRDSVPSTVQTMTIHRVLQGLLSERVSIRNLPVILEAIIEAAGFTRRVPGIIEHVRERLGQTICASLSDETGTLNVISIVSDWENELNAGVIVDGDDRSFSLPPERIRAFLVTAREKIQANTHVDPSPSIVVSSEIRPYVKSLIGRMSPSTAVISHNEIPSKQKVKSVDVIGYTQAQA